MKPIVKDVKDLIEADDDHVTVIELNNSSSIKEQLEFLKDSKVPVDPSTPIM
jgi:hypothetical protein